MSYARGDFSFLPERLSHEKNMLEDAWSAMESVTGSWEYLAKPDVPDPDKGFMFSRDPFLAKISKEVDKDGKIGHSGASYGWTMRQIESIAKDGWDAYVTLRLMNIKRKDDEEQARLAAEAAKPPRYFNDPFFISAESISSCAQCLTIDDYWFFITADPIDFNRKIICDL